MKEISLIERKSLQFDLLVKIDALCRAQGYRYYLSSGTLLGAVRHKGYIPWDDDIDIAMPRPDYEALYQYFNAHNSDNEMQLISYRDKTSIYPFFKMVNPKTIVVEHYVNPAYRTGVWVDIFPLDGVKKGDTSPFRLNEKTQSRYNVITANPKYATSVFRKMVKTILVPLFHSRDIYKVAQTLDETLASTPICPQNDVALVTWGYGEKERMPYSILEPCELEFEGRRFYAPRDWDTYLTSIFGNYMTPPPANQREAHFCTAYWKD